MPEKVYTWIIYMLHLASTGYICGTVFGWKYQGKWKNLQKFLTLAAIVVGIYLVRLVFPEGSLSRMVVTTIMTMFYMILPFAGSLKKRLVLSAVTTVVAWGIEFLAYGLLAFWGVVMEDFWNDRQASMAHYAVSVYYMMFYIGVMLAIWGYYIKRKFVKEQLLFLTIPCFQFVQLLIFLFMDVKAEEYLMLAGLSIVSFDILLDCGLICFLRDMEKRFETEEKLTALYNQRQYELEYYRSMHKNMEEIRGIRHDYMNQIQTVQFLLDGGDEAENIKRLAECREKHIRVAEKRRRTMDGQKTGVYVAHPVLDAILSLKREQAEKYNINMQISCDMVRTCKLDEVEICSLFGNLLDNAIEACEKVERAEKEIILEIMERGDTLFIRCRNSFERSKVDKSGFWVSLKAEKDKHGIGLKMIEKICRKYNGYVKKTIQERTVCIEISI